MVRAPGAKDDRLDAILEDKLGIVNATKKQQQDNEQQDSDDSSSADEFDPLLKMPVTQSSRKAAYNDARPPRAKDHLCFLTT